jgi:hypothetical protein
MKLPPYDIFPNIIGDKISLRQIHLSDISDIIEISFYDAVQATTLQQTIEMQAKIIENIQPTVFFQVKTEIIDKKNEIKSGIAVI